VKIEKNGNGQAALLIMRKPMDGHHHVRQGDLLRLVAPMASKRFAMAVIMPNVSPPITTAAMVARYAGEIRAAAGPEEFSPLMTMYLTDSLDPAEVEKAEGVVGVKYYPRGLTTNSHSGVADPSALWTPGTQPYTVLRTLAERKRVLLLHAADGFDKNGNELDPYEQERHFIRETLPRIIDAHPTLKISVEHLSTSVGAEFMLRNGSEKLGCSLTLHHLTLDRRDVFRGGFHPHTHWWPIIQGQEDKEALRELAKADLPYVWLGTDSAPHPVGKKEAACCLGGVLTAHMGIESYLEAFEDMHALDDRFERFASVNGPRFYGLEQSDGLLTLVREEWKVEKPFQCFTAEGSGVETFVPFRLGELVRWKLAA
jgi:dihydroorotase